MECNYILEKLVSPQIQNTANVWSTKIRFFLIFVFGTLCTHVTKIRIFLTFVTYVERVPNTKIRKILTFVMYDLACCYKN